MRHNIEADALLAMYGRATKYTHAEKLHAFANAENHLLASSYAIGE